MITHTFTITDLHCEACVKLSKGALVDIPDVTKAEVDLPTGRAFVESNREVGWEEITKALEEVGKHAQEDGQTVQS